MSARLPEAALVESPIIEVHDEEEARRQIDSLYGRDVPINLLGAGHLLSNRASVGGVLLANRIRNRLEMRSSREMLVSTGWKWTDVIDFAQDQGVSFPVLTSNLDTTVGGTLSAGGFGLFSHREGMQADHVLGCTIHTAEGTFECERSGDPLWRSALCSLGTIGFVSSVRLEIRPEIDRVWMWERRDPPAEGIDVFLEAAASFEQDSSFATCRFEYGTATTRIGFLAGQQGSRAALPEGWRRQELDYATLLRQSTLPQSPVRRVWNDFILPIGNARDFLVVALEQLDRAERHSGILRQRVRLLGIGRTAPSGSDFYLRPRVLGRSQTIGVGFYLDVAFGDVDSLRFADEQHALLNAASQAAGGAPYNAGEIRMSEADCRRSLGGDWDSFKAARGRYDPKGLFGNGNTLPVEPSLSKPGRHDPS